MWADISDAEMCTRRGEAVCFLKKTAANTVILLQLLTPICRTVILWKSSEAHPSVKQMLLLSFLGPVSLGSIWSKNSPSLKALAAYRKTRISQVGLRCVMCQLPFLHPTKKICSLQLCVVNEPRLYWWMRAKEHHKCYQNLVKILCWWYHPVAAPCALVPLTSWPGPLELLVSIIRQ